MKKCNMMKNQSKKLSLVKVVIGLCTFGGAWLISNVTPAHAADPITIGVLDEGRLGKGYTKYAAELDTLQKRAAVLDAYLDARQVLNETEGKRFDELIAKRNRAGADETEFQKLVEVGSTRRKNRIALVGKAE